MNRPSPEEFLESIGGMYESVLIGIEFSNFFRTATLRLDRVVEPGSGRLLSEPSEQAVEIRVEGLRDFHFASNLGEFMWGPGTFWGINEMQEVDLFEHELGQGIELSGMGELRAIRLVGKTVEIGFMDPVHAEKAIRTFWDRVERDMQPYDWEAD